MTEQFLKPATEGLIVRDPITGQPLSGEGESKPLSKYWRRRLRDKDVVTARAPRKSKTTEETS